MLFKTNNIVVFCVAFIEREKAWRRDEKPNVEPWERQLAIKRLQQQVDDKIRILSEKRKADAENRQHEEHLRAMQRTELEEEKRRQENLKRLQSEAEICRRRDELFNYRFGEKTKLDCFQGIQFEDVTQLRIGVFGPCGSGKTSFIDMCERTLRQTAKGSTPADKSMWTMTLEDYLPEMFFHLVDTSGFFNYSANEIAEFENILYGKRQSGDEIVYYGGGQASSAKEMNRNPAFGQRIHGVIIVVKANDPRLTCGALQDYLKPFLDIPRKTGND